MTPSCGHLAPPYDNAMNDSRYRSGRTAGDKWGCGLAAIVACPLFFFLVLVQALGDCVPDLPCHKSFWLMVVSPTVLVGTAVGLGVRWLANRLLRNGS